MPKAALYARYSSDLQNVHSIDDQLLVCRELAAREGWEIVAYYHDEAVSGASMRGRAGLLQLLADAKARQFDILCAEALDRISRDQGMTCSPDCYQSEVESGSLMMVG